MTDRIIMCVGEDRALRPADAQSSVDIAKLPPGAMVSVRLKRVRSIKHHRKFFALISAVHEAQDQFVTQEALLDAIKVHLGHYVAGKIGDQTVFLPKSISFDAMGQDEFNAFYDRAMQAISEHILPGVERADLRKHIHEIMDGEGTRKKEPA